MNDTFLIKIDGVGRIVIPKKVRVKYGIKANDVFDIVLRDDCFEMKLTNIKEKYPKIIGKLEYLESEFGIEFLLYDAQTIIYTSKNYQFLKNRKCTTFSKALFEQKPYGKIENFEVVKDYVLNCDLFYQKVSLDTYLEAIVLFICKSSIDDKLVKVINLLLS